MPGGNDVISNVLFNSRVANPPRSVGTACGPSHFIAMTIDEFMRTLERAWEHALPGHEAVERDEMQRALRRLLEAHEPRPRTDPTAPGPRLAIHCWVRAVLLS
jgi:hypothetical protein